MIIKILHYIDEHIREPLSVGGIAQAAGYSPYHFSRMFSLATGLPVMEYVRKRKLEYAAVDIGSGERLLDIAVRYGFESHESLTRAFKREYGMPPRAFRALQNTPISVPPLTIPATERRTTMEVLIKSLGERRVIGYRFQTQPASAEIPQYWYDVMHDDRWQRLISKASPDAMNFGICINMQDAPEGWFDYMIAFDHNPSAPVDPDMALFTIPAAQYAVLRVPNTPPEAESGAPEIREGWNYLYTQWYPNSGYTYDEGKPEFEVYPDSEHCEIYIPVVKKV